DLIRPLLAWRPDPENPSAAPPKGSTGDGGFVVIPEMMSILGCSPEELGAVFMSLGFRLDRRPVKKAQSPVVQATEPVVEPPADAQGVQEPVPGAEQPSASDQPAPQLAPATVSAAAEAEAESPETAPAEAAEAPSVTPVEPAQPTAADATA